MRIRDLQPGDESRWDLFVRNNSSGTFFHLSGWKNIFENVLHHPTYYLYCEAGDEIRAVLPLAHVKSLLFGNALISLPFLVYGGVLSTDSMAEKMLLDAATEKAEMLNVDYLELRNMKASTRDWPRMNHYATFSKTLDPDPEKNLMAIPRKQRAMIRKAFNFELSAELDSDANRLYEAMLPCKRNLGTPFFGKRYLQSIMDQFGQNVEVTTITKKSDTICSVMSFRFRDQILPYYGGGGDSARALNGNDFMYWSVMEKACRDGVRIFDYGRSMEGSGAYRFKKHWGFEPAPLCYEFHLVGGDSLPNLNPSNAKYALAIRLWKKLPLPIAGTIGPFLARRLG
jgi:FemAB-related protein (PEP-CTERM system-associated)